MLYALSVTFLYETGPIQWMFNQHCGCWWPGALAPGTRASVLVVTVLTALPCVSQCLGVNLIFVTWKHLFNSSINSVLGIQYTIMRQSLGIWVIINLTIFETNCRSLRLWQVKFRLDELNLPQDKWIKLREKFSWWANKDVSFNYSLIYIVW